MSGNWLTHSILWAPGITLRTLVLETRTSRAESSSQPWGLVLESPSVAQATLELEVILPPQPPGCGDHRCELILYLLSNFEDKKVLRGHLRQDLRVSGTLGLQRVGKSPEMMMDRSLWDM